MDMIVTMNGPLFGINWMTGRHLASGKPTNVNVKFDVNMAHTTQEATRFQMLESAQQSDICRSDTMSFRISLHCTAMGHLRRGMQTNHAVFLRHEQICSQMFHHIATTVLEIQKHHHQ